MSNYVRYTGENNRGPSPIIFGDLAKCYHDQWVGKCVVVYDDFASLGVLASAGASGPPYSYQDSGVTIQGETDLPNLGSAGALGELRIVHDGTDHDEAHFQLGSGSVFRLETTAANAGKVMFECRIRKSTIADSGLAFFAGLGTANVASGYLVDTSGALAADKGYIGFRNLHDDGDHVDTIFQEISQTQVEVLANAATMVADTFMKLGFIYDPSFPDDKKIKFFVDGVDTGTYVTKTQMDAVTFPQATSGLVPMFLTQIETGTAFEAGVDWICAVQYQAGEE